MKKSLITVLLSFIAISSIVVAKPNKKATSSGEGKTTVKCPSAAKLKAGIEACPDTGCGTVDPLLNKQKNIDVNDQAPEDKDFQYLADLPEKVPGYANIGDPRDALASAGEGKMIRVVAWALVARKGSKESCNCGLSRAIDTDNHIVLVDEETLKLRAKATPEQPATDTKKAVPARSAAQNTLKKREEHSQTAEFAPRVRVHHPNLVGQDLQKLITAQRGKLLVRVTGMQMYDSEHALGRHLPRHNDWEIHPVFRLEYCPKGKACEAGSDANWKELGQ